MKCPKCDINLLEHVDVCPFCKTPLKEGADGKLYEDTQRSSAEKLNQDTGRYSAIDPSKDSYDFDLQYTLTFRDAGEIRQAIADMELGLGQTKPEELLDTEPVPSAEPHRFKHDHSIEEMEEAARRAEMRRAKRQGKVSKDTGKRQKIERLSRTEREKAAALKAARVSKKDKHLSERSYKGLLMGVGVVVIVVALIVGAVNLFASMLDGDPAYPTVYAKDNQLFMYYDQKEMQLSSNFISAYGNPQNVQPTATATSSASSESRSTAKPSAVPDPKQAARRETLSEKKLISLSADGTQTYLLENVDMTKGAGDLIYFLNGNAKSRQSIAQNVYYKIVRTKDGTGILFLRNADETGFHGELCYWNSGMKEAVSVEQDICTGNFLFSQDGLSAMYIKNFNPIVNTGDLCIKSFEKDAGDSRMIDEKVAFVFGTTPKSKIYLYAKDYDTTSGTYNLYMQKENESPNMVAERALLAPVLTEKAEGFYAYSNYQNGFQSLNYVDLAAGTNTRLAEQLTEVTQVRKDEGAVIYTIAYENENDKADYYFVTASEPNSQKIATSVDTSEELSKKNITQFDVSDDFSRIAYIGGYDRQAFKGALYTLTIINGYAGTEKKISDDAYACDVSADGATVRFANSYNADTDTVNLVSYANSNTLGLTEGVAKGAFTFDKTGEYMVYARNVDQETVIGTLECVNAKAKVREIDPAVSAYGVKSNGEIIILKREGEGENPPGKLYRCKQNGRGVKEITQGVTKVLTY